MQTEHALRLAIEDVVTLTGEYEGMERTIDGTDAEFLQTNMMAVEAAFAGPDLKEQLRIRLVEAYGNANLFNARINET